MDEQNPGYLKFKTPFYEVVISDSSGKRKVKLPHYIARLIEKVEVQEYLSAEQGPNTLIMTIVEGSREPSYSDDNGMGQYSVDSEIGEAITNRVGSVIDLVFEGTTGITFAKPKIASGKDIKTTNSGNNKSVSANKTNERPRYLFQERNLVKVTWGYLESPETVRSITLPIMVVQTEFSEASMTRTTITCQGSSVALDQIATKQGRTFAKRITTGKGNSIVEFEDLATDELLRKIAKDAGIPVIISKDMQIAKFDKSKQKTWIAGESFKEFLDRLASMENAIWKIVYDEKTGVDNIVFIKRNIFERTFIPGFKKEYFMFKQPGSILRNVNIRVDFGGIAGNTQSGLTDNGDAQSKEDVVGATEVRQFGSDNTKEQALDVSPLSNNPIAIAQKVSDNVANGQTTGTVNHNPSTNAKQLDSMASVNAYKQHNLVNLDFVCVGYTKVTPGVVDIGNIGVRYSGKYRILTVTHTIDSQGYITKGTAISWAAPKGVKIEGTNKGEEPKDEDVQVQQFAAASDELVAYHKLQGTV